MKKILSFLLKLLGILVLAAAILLGWLTATEFNPAPVEAAEVTRAGDVDMLKGGDDPSAPEMRVTKEVWRAMAFVGGIGFSPAENDIMQPLYSLKELDANRYPFVQPMNMVRMYKMWKRFVVKKERRIPYRVAVQEGWAAPPTNDYQKAVWEQVKADKERGPTNPITIQPPNAKK